MAPARARSDQLSEGGSTLAKTASSIHILPTPPLTPPLPHVITTISGKRETAARTYRTILGLWHSRKARRLYFRHPGYQGARNEFPSYLGYDLSILFISRSNRALSFRWVSAFTTYPGSSLSLFSRIHAAAKSTAFFAPNLRIQAPAESVCVFVLGQLTLVKRSPPVCRGRLKDANAGHSGEQSSPKDQISIAGGLIWSGEPI